jgi:DNA-binding transcriptional regulator YiaG
VKKKIVKNYIYEGLGFPITLHNVELVEFDGEFHPKIDARKISDMAIISLVDQKSRLTGNQIKFIRKYFFKSLREFSIIVNESHMAVKKWENFNEKPTNMDINIEILLRLFIYDQTSIKFSNDKKRLVNFYRQYKILREMFAENAFKNKSGSNKHGRSLEMRV